MVFSLSWPFGAAAQARRQVRDRAESLYRSAVDQARQPKFYRDLGILDTPEGRFEMVALHVWLLLHRLKTVPEAAGLSQALHDVMMLDMDVSLRELGISDVVIGKRVKAVAKNFYGRLQAYDAGLADPAAFAERRPKPGRTWHLRFENDRLVALAAFPARDRFEFTAAGFGL